MAANSILKLKVESSEYDAKLKKAAEGIQHLAEVAHRGGGDLTGLEKAELDFIKALGDMETKSRTASGQVRELSNTYKELAFVYSNLNDVEKNDEGGKALAASLATLRQRAQDAKAQMDAATQSLQGNANAGKEDGGVLEQLAGKFMVNIDALKLFDLGLKAVNGALKVAKDAFFASEAAVDEWGRTTASAQALYDGFLTAINNGDISGYLNNMNQIVQAARQAYNELDLLGTMKTIQAPAMSRQESENQRLRTMLMTGRYVAPADGRRSSPGLKNGDLLTPAQMKVVERQLQSGMNNIVTLTKREVKQTGKAIDAYYNSIAKQNGMSLQEFRKGTSSWDEFSKKLKGYEEYRRWDARARSEFARQGGRGYVDFDKNNPYAAYRSWGTFRVDKMGQNSYNDLVGLIRQQQQQQSQVYATIGQAYRAINRTEGVTVRNIMGGGGGGGKTVGKATGTVVPLEGSIDAQTQKVAELTKAWKAATDQVGRDGYLKQLEEAQQVLEKMTEKPLRTPDVAYGQGDLTGKGGTAEIGGGFKLDTTLEDNARLREALGLAPHNTPLKLDEEAMAAVEDLTDKVAEANKKADALETVSKAVGALSQISGGLQQMGITLPKGVDKAIGVVQGLIAVIQGVNSFLEIIGVTQQTTELASRTANTAALTALTSAIVANTAAQAVSTVVPFARGGVVKAAGGVVAGNTYSGDQIPAMLNAGEVVLNRAQASTLASVLQDGGGGGGYQPSHISGEQIWIAMNRYTKRTGRGEVVTWR